MHIKALFFYLHAQLIKNFNNHYFNFLDLQKLVVFVVLSSAEFTLISVFMVKYTAVIATIISVSMSA